MLGWDIDGERGRILPKARRLWRLRLACEHLLGQTVVEASDVEKIVGHMTFVGLLSRPVLSVLSAVYCWIAQHRGGTSILWPSVKNALRAFTCLLPLVRADLHVNICQKVLCTDASGWGFGVVSRRWEKDAVKMRFLTKNGC